MRKKLESYDAMIRDDVKGIPNAMAIINSERDARRG
jgi:hypothetical protein